jgi:hypothetical protein
MGTCTIKKRTDHCTDQARGHIRLRTNLGNVAKRTNTTPLIKFLWILSYGNLNQIFQNYKHYALHIQNNNIYSINQP